MTPEEAQVLIAKLQERYYGEGLTEREVLEKALDEKLHPSWFLLVCLILANQFGDAWPAHSGWIMLVSIVVGAGGALSAVRERRRLKEAQSYFMKCAPATLADALAQLKNGKP